MGTKSRGELLGWTLLDDTAGIPTLISNVLDSGEGLNTSEVCLLHIDMCHADTNAAGNYAYCIVLIRGGGNDDDWHVLIKLQATYGTANQGDCDQASASGQPNVYVTSTTNFENPGDVYFLKDEGSLTNSQLIMNKDYVNDDYIINIKNLTNTFDDADNVYDIVDQWNIPLPKSVEEAMVVFSNEDADATYACRIQYTMFT